MKNKENTKRKLLDAVGNLIKEKGFNGLGVNKVAKAAGVSKILIYRYFGTYNNLVKSYVLEKDFWSNYFSEHDLDENSSLSIPEQISKLLSEQFSYFYNHCEMEAVMLNEISNEHQLLKNISNNSLPHSRKLTPSKGDNQNDYTTCFNIVSALLVAGTNQLLMQKNALVETADGTLILAPEEDLLQAMEQIVHWTFG